MNASQSASQSKYRTKALHAKTARLRPSTGKTSRKKATKPSRAKSSREKVRAYRERMRKRGMKLIRLHVTKRSGMTSKTTVQRSKAPRARTPTGKALRKKASKTPKSSREKVQAYRKRMRAKGLRLVQMWLPDTRTPEFAAQAHKDSLAIADSPTEHDDQAFIDSVQWLTSEEAEALSQSEPERWWKEPSD
jgi:hypothetical protein